MAIQNVVFDMGNVLYDFDYRRAYQPLQRYLEMDYDTFYRDIVEGPRKAQLDCGEIDPEQFYAWLVERHWLRCEFPVFKEAWQSIFTEVPVMVEMGIGLQRDYGTYLLSNTDPMHMEKQCNETRLLKVTGQLGLSYEYGCVKPGETIYRRFLEGYGLEAPTCVFIDDLEENVRAAEQVGMTGVHHTSPETTRYALDALGMSW